MQAAGKPGNDLGAGLPAHVPAIRSARPPVGRTLPNRRLIVRNQSGLRRYQHVKRINQWPIPQEARTSMKNSADPSTSQVPGPAPGSFWGSLNPAEQRAFMSLALKRTFASGATLMQEGEPANHVIVILSGWTRITVSDGDRTRVIAERGPGQLVGERAALQVSVRSATVVALETVDGLVVRTSDFAGFVSAHPGVLAIVEGQVYERLTEESARLTPRSGREARQDLAGWGYGVAETHLAGPPAERSPLGQLQPFRGENCTVVLTDVVGFGARIRNDDDRLVIRKSLLEMTGAALGALTDGVLLRRSRRWDPAYRTRAHPDHRRPAAATRRAARLVEAA